MIRLRRSLKVLQVAAHASRIRARQAVVAVCVALCALHRGMRPRQRETRTAVIKSRVVPRGRGVALLASRRESRLHVIGRGRAVEVLHMARSAIRRCPHKLTVDVALGAGYANVPPGEREFRERVVIEVGHIPRARVMASLAGGGEARLRMRRIACLIEVRQVATHAGGRRSREFPTHVTRRAIQRGVRTGQRKAGELQMVELRAHPVVHGVALFATGGQVQLHVVQPGRSRINKVFLMAGEARG